MKTFGESRSADGEDAGDGTWAGYRPVSGSHHRGRERDQSDLAR